jgi:hypothetical protein
LIRRALPLPADHTELQRLASELAAEPLHGSRPLWRYDFIENYEGGSAIIMRIHHCIADGIALVGVMLSMADLDADAPWPEPPPAKALTTSAITIPRRFASLVNPVGQIVLRSAIKDASLSNTDCGVPLPIPPALNLP